jgi:FKBP-type peptidyl-prolyl cis-trans isomerase SlyD
MWILFGGVGKLLTSGKSADQSQHICTLGIGQIPPFLHCLLGLAQVKKFYILMMNISPPCVVELTWTLTDTLNEELDVLSEPVEFFVGGQDLLAKIEEALMGHEAGDELALHLEPEEAFGDYDENKVFLEARSLFPAEIEEGMTFDGSALVKTLGSHLSKDLIYTVTDLYPEHVVLDGNHPLAGIALRLKLKIHGIREATDSEMANGSLGIGFFQPLNTSDQEWARDEDEGIDPQGDDHPGKPLNDALGKKLFLH